MFGHRTAPGRAARSSRVVAGAAVVALSVSLAAQASGAEVDDSSEVAASPAPGARAIFAPGTDPDYVDAVLASLLPEHTAIPRHRFDDHWNPANTAANNGGAGQGDALELTWSIIPDGTFMPALDALDTACNSNLIAKFDAAYGAGAWQAEIQNVFDDWTALSGNVYTPAVGLDPDGNPIDDGAAWPGSPGALGLRGDVRIGGCTIDGDFNTLAYNYFPDTGDMKIDADDFFYGGVPDGALSPGFHNVFSHEHGHGAGLSHVCPIDNTKLMEPFLNTAFLGLQHDDIRGVQRGYGDRFEVINAPNDSVGQATVLSPVGGQAEALLSLDGTSDVDWFSFPANSGDTIDVTVTPVGFTYLESRQCLPGTLLDSSALQDLTFEIRDGDGVLATIDATAAGAAEAIAGFLVTSSQDYFIRILGSGTDDVQLYDLSVTQTKSTVTETDLSITKVDDIDPARASEMLTYTIEVTNAGPIDATDVAINDVLPAGATLDSTSGCAEDPGGVPTCTVGVFGPGTTTVTIVVDIDELTTGTITNSATVVSTTPDPDPLNNSTTEDTLILPPLADISVMKTDGVMSATPGKDTLTYTIAVANAGPSNDPAVVVTDLFPDPLTCTYTSVAAGGALFNTAAGAGDISETSPPLSMPAGSTVTYTATCAIDPTATGTLSNIVNAIGTHNDPTPVNNEATDDTVLLPRPMVSVAPARVYESRIGPGFSTVDGLFEGIGQTLGGTVSEFVIAGRGGVAEDADAAFLNVVAVFPTGPGFLTVFPCGETPPNAANVNYDGGDIAANAVLAKVGVDGKVCVFAEDTTDIVIDVNGYVPGAGTPTPLSPARVYESRIGQQFATVDAQFEGVGRTIGGTVAEFVMAGRGGVPADADAAFLNVVAVFPTGPGFLTVFPCGTGLPLAANVNYDGGDVAANAVLAEIGVDGKICVFAEDTSDIVIDVNGFVPAGGSPTPVLPARLYESRVGAGFTTIDGLFEGVGQTIGGTVSEVVVAGRGLVPEDAEAAFLNVVAVFPTGPGFLTVFPCGTEPPLAANVNYDGGDVAANAVLAKIGVDGKVCVFAEDTTDLVIDVNGFVPA